MMLPRGPNMVSPSFGVPCYEASQTAGRNNSVLEINWYLDECFTGSRRLRDPVEGIQVHNQNNRKFIQ